MKNPKEKENKPIADAILNKLYDAVDAGLLEEYTRIRCPHCEHMTGPAYTTLLTIPVNGICDHCGKEIEDQLIHVRIMFRKKREERESREESDS